MKLKIFILLSILILGMNACQKSYQSVGMITGPDLAMCPSCGGWFILIDSISYNFDKLPSTSNNQILLSNFPILIKLDWNLKQENGSRKWIEITRATKY